MEQQPARVGGSSTLRRSRTDRVLGGVCGGLGRYLGIDPVLVRIIFVVLVVFGGSGVVLYLLAWLIIPEDTGLDADAPDAPGPDSATTGRVIVGAILVGIGGLMFADRFVPALNSLIGPMVFVVAGLAVLFLAVGRPSPGSDAEPASPGPAGPPPAPPSPEEMGTTRREALASPPRADDDRVAPTALWEPEPSSAPGRILLGGLLVLVGVLWLVDLTGAIALDWRIVLPVALVVVGLVTVVLAWTGHRTGGFVALGIVLAFAVIGSSLLPDRLSATIGDRVERPASVQELAAEHGLGIGKLTLDLRSVDLDRSRTVEASVGIGELVVLIPRGVDLDVTARVGAGEAVALDRSRSGVGVNLRERFPAPGTAVAPTLTLDLSVGFGKIEVRR